MRVSKRLRLIEQGHPSSGSSLLTLCSSTMQKKQAPTSATSSTAPIQTSTIAANNTNSTGNPPNVTTAAANATNNGIHTSGAAGKRKRLSSNASHSSARVGSFVICHPHVLIGELMILQQRFKQDPQSPTSKEAMAEISKYGSLGDFAFFDKVCHTSGVFYSLINSNDYVVNLCNGL